MAIAFALRLAAKHHGNAASVIIMLIEHQGLLTLFESSLPDGLSGRK
jgi:hypothetical protein